MFHPIYSGSKRTGPSSLILLVCWCFDIRLDALYFSSQCGRSSSPDSGDNICNMTLEPVHWKTQFTGEDHILMKSGLAL